MDYGKFTILKEAEKERKSNKNRQGKLKTNNKTVSKLKTINKTVDISPFFLVIILKTNGLNTSIKSYRI